MARIISRDFKHGIVKIKIENLDDLWILSQIIEPGDLISGKTIRKIKLDNEKGDVVKKSLFLKLNIEKVEFHDTTNVLRVSGKIIDGPDDISFGSYHTFNLEEGVQFTLYKNKWLKYQKEKIDELENQKVSNILIVVFDRDEAILSKVKKFGYEVLTKISGDSGKKVEGVVQGNFLKDLAKLIVEYDKRQKFDHIILASPSFFKDDLKKNLSNISSKIVLASCSSAKESAINEVLKREEVQFVLKEERASLEMKLVEQLLANISKEEKNAYGLKEVEKVSNLGAIEILLIVDSYLLKLRKEGNYKKLESIMKIVEENRGKIHIISSEHDGGKKLLGLGGVGAILRFNVV